MADRVRITDVSPRDGLQNEPGAIPTADKVRLVELLCATGVDEVEVTSFVSPRWVPQLGDAADLLDALARAPALADAGQARRAPILSALVPNQRGMQDLLDVNGRAGRSLVGKVAVFTAASETFSRRNTNAPIAQTIDRFRPVVASALAAGLQTRGYISCVIACPFEGPIAPGAVVRVAEALLELGIREIDLGDTIGAGTRDSVTSLLREYASHIPIQRADPATTLHLHDTFGRAADCVTAALDLGVRSFDGSVAGLGGCPYASTPGKRAPGNISTERLVRTVEDAGFTTGVDMDRLAEAAAFARRVVARSRSAAENPPGGAA